MSDTIEDKTDNQPGKPEAKYGFDKPELAIAVGLGGVALVGLATYFLSKQDTDISHFSAIVDPPELRVKKLQESLQILQAKAADSKLPPAQAAALHRSLRNIEQTLQREAGKIPKPTSPELEEKKLKEWQEENKRLLQASLEERKSALKKGAWAKLSKDRGSPALQASKIAGQLAAEAAERDKQRRQKKEESERRRIAVEREKEEQKLQAKHESSRKKLEAALSKTVIASPGLDAYMPYGSPNPDRAKFEWEALNKIRYTSFEIPDEPEWMSAIEHFIAKGLLVEKPDPKDPEFSIYEFTSEGKKLLPGGNLRDKCMMRVSLGALPADVAAHYKVSGGACGAHTYTTKDGRPGYVVRAIRRGESGEPVLVTELWARQKDNSWQMEDAKAQRIEESEFKAAKLPVAEPPSKSDREKMEEVIRRQEETIAASAKKLLETRGPQKLPPKEITPELDRWRSRVHVPRGGSSLSPIRDDRLVDEFLVKGKRVRVKFHEGDHEKVRQILHHNPPTKASAKEVARQLFVLGADFARTEDGKPGYEGVYK